MDHGACDAFIANSGQIFVCIKRSYQAIPIENNRVLLCSSSSNSYLLESDSVDVYGLVLSLLRGTIANFSRGQIKGCSLLGVAEDICNLVQEMRRMGILCEYPINTLPDEVLLDRFDREIAFLGDIEQNSHSRFDYFRQLRQAHILLIGMGSLGSGVLQHLVVAGIGSITGVDFDIVEPSNLPRQFLYSANDIGILKTTAAARSLKGISDKVQFNTINKRIESKSDVLEIIDECPRVDLIINTADIPIWKASLWITAAALTRNIPLIRGNRLGIGPLMIPGKSACPGCAWPIMHNNIPNATDILNRLHRYPPPPPAVLSTHIAFAAAALAHEVILFLCNSCLPRTINHVLRLSLNTVPYVTSEAIVKSPQCPVCGDPRDI